MVNSWRLNFSHLCFRKKLISRFGVWFVIVAFILNGCAQTRTTGQCIEAHTAYQRYDCMRDTIFGAESRAQRAALSASVFNGAMSFGLGGSYTTARFVEAAVNNVQLPQNVNGGDDGGFQLYWSDLVSKTNNNRSRMASDALADIRADSHRLERFVKAFSEVAREDEYLITNKVASTPKVVKTDLANALKNERERHAQRLEIIISLAQLKMTYEKVFNTLQIDKSPKAQQGLATLEKFENSVREDFNRCNGLLETVGLGIGDEFGEKTNSLSSININSESERAILNESVMTGAAAGAAVGIVAALILGKKSGNTALNVTLGAGVGGAGGYLAGRVIGVNRIREIRDLRLENSKMDDFLNAADFTNKKIADQNRELSQQISSLLKKKSDEERKVAAQKELSLVQKQQQEIKKLMEERRIIADALYTKQKNEYEKRLDELKKQDKTLTDLITQLGDIAQDGRIG